MPTLKPKPPTGPDWSHEVKFDGYRIQIHRDGSAVKIYSRNGADFTSRFPAIAKAALSVRFKAFVLDAEAVADNFHELHLRRANAIAYAFDVLALGQNDLRALPLIERRKHLARFGTFQISATFDDPHKLLAQCEAMGLEGIVSKRLASPYKGGRSLSWVKVKTTAWREANRERYRMFQTSHGHRKRP